MISAGSDTWKYYVYLSAPFLQAEQPVSQLVDFICSRILAVHSTGEPLEITVRLVRQLPLPSKSQVPWSWAMIRNTSTFPRPWNALTVSQPVNAWNPGNDLHVLAAIRSPILETSKYFTLVWELHLMNMEDGIKLLKAKHSNKISVSSDTIITATNFDLAAWAACSSNLASASSWDESWSVRRSTTPDDNW